MIFVYRTSVVGPSGIPLSDYEERAIIKLNEGGSPVEFYVAKHDYEPDLNGAGRTLVARTQVLSNIGAWNSSGINAYANSTRDKYLNSTYKNTLDPIIQQEIGETTFYYTPGNNTNNVTTLTRGIFIPSITELGRNATPDSANVEGTALPVANLLSENDQMSRTPSIIPVRIIYGIENALVPGGMYAYQPTQTVGSTILFTLPSTLLFNPDTNEVVA